MLGHVMMDRDLAALYCVETKVLNQAVRRNIERFPDDFMFQLTDLELKNWKSQKVVRLETTRCRQQYAPFTIKQFKNAHDRFLILDGAEVYHIGASLKDLGIKWFTFSRMALPASEILKRLL
jgi:hypothetical protein